MILHRFGPCAAVLLILAPFATPQDVIEADWWSNRTSSSNVEEATVGGLGEYVRLGDATSGYVEGEISLAPAPMLVIREVVYGVTAAPGGMAPGETVRLFLGGGLIWEFSGLGGEESSIESFTAWGLAPQTNTVPYRIEFESPVADADEHALFMRGRLMRRIFDVSIGLPQCALAPNSVSPGVMLLATGSRSVSANDFTLRSAGGPPGDFALHIYSRSSQRNPFGAGYLCVGGGGIEIVRLGPPLAFDASGQTTRVVDLANPPTPTAQITAGTTWYFQLWYRDSAVGGFNLAESLRVPFTP